MFRLSLTFALTLAALSVPAIAQDPAMDAKIDQGNRLAALLRAGRSVVSSNQDLINDPSKADKGLTSDAFLAQVTEAYVAATGHAPLDDDLAEGERALIEAQLAAMREVVDEQQGLINTPDLGFKGFIPAVFARLTNERFGEKTRGAATIKVTAPPELVRNRKARPDDWEAGMLADRFAAADWPKGQAVAAEVDGGFRMLIPEYYNASCLTCHGEPKGEVDVTGFPKEGGHEGDLAGAISITLAE